jgi:hypothetical protein
VSDLGWNATIGNDRLALHMPMKQWGWNARGCSSVYLAVELAQPLESFDITDGQVRAFAEFWRLARMAWPNLPAYFPTHSELDGTRAYGPTDGKTDVFSKSSPRTEALRARIQRAIT